MSTCSCIEDDTTLADRHVLGLTEIFRLLGEPNRLRLVLACMDEPQAVGSLAGALGLSQTLVSHHLRLLRTAHLLRAERDGRQVRYGIDDDHVRAMLRNMIAHLTEPHEHASDGAEHVVHDDLDADV